MIKCQSQKGKDIRVTYLNVNRLDVNSDNHTIVQQHIFLQKKGVNIVY